MVASDMFGDAYIIPMTSILRDIKKHLRAESVELPSTIDFSIIALNKNPAQDAFPLEFGLSCQHDFNFETSFPETGDVFNFGRMGDWPSAIELVRTGVAGYEEPPASTMVNGIPSGLHSPIEQSTDSGYHTLDTTPSGPSPDTSPPKNNPSNRKLKFPAPKESTLKRDRQIAEVAQRWPKRTKLDFDSSKETGPRTPEQ